jgi:hypothetical protein
MLSVDSIAFIDEMAEEWRTEDTRPSIRHRERFWERSLRFRAERDALNLVALALV